MVDIEKVRSAITEAFPGNEIASLVDKGDWVKDKKANWRGSYIITFCLGNRKRYYMRISPSDSDESLKSEHPAVDGKTHPSSNEGGEPFEIRENEYVFDKLKPGFYRYVDVRWRALWEDGFVMAGPSTWFCKPKHYANLEQAKNISRYVMARYGAYNLVWALSGEYSFGEQKKHAPWDEVSGWNEIG